MRGYLPDHHADYVFLDCPPSLGLLTLNALVAARARSFPDPVRVLRTRGVTQLLRTIDLVKGELNNELRLSTVLLTMFDARTKLAAQVADEVRQHFPAETLPTSSPLGAHFRSAQLRPDRSDLPAQLGRCHFLPRSRTRDRPPGRGGERMNIRWSVAASAEA